MKLSTTVIHTMIRGYQYVSAAFPPVCRYMPTCSSYALEALELHGTAKGSWLTVRRLCRCHPLGSMGWDPVPGSEDAIQSKLVGSQFVGDQFVGELPIVEVSRETELSYSKDCGAGNG